MIIDADTRKAFPATIGFAALMDAVLPDTPPGACFRFTDADGDDLTIDSDALVRRRTLHM